MLRLTLHAHAWTLVIKQANPSACAFTLLNTLFALRSHPSRFLSFRPDPALYLKLPFFEVDVTSNFCDSMRFIFGNNFLNISMIF